MQHQAFEAVAHGLRSQNYTPSTIRAPWFGTLPVHHGLWGRRSAIGWLIPREELPEGLNAAGVGNVALRALIDRRYPGLPMAWLERLDTLNQLAWTPAQRERLLGHMRPEGVDPEVQAWAGE